MHTIVIKLGGSLLSPYETAIKQISSGALPFDFNYSAELVKILSRSKHRIVILIGGGFLNRWYLRNVKQLFSDVSQSVNDLHTIGIASSVINASTFKILMQQHIHSNRIYPEVVKFTMYDEMDTLFAEIEKHQFVIASGGKPGHSHDLDAVVFAELFKVTEFFSLKNIDGVYTADPAKDPNAKRLANLNWEEYEKIIKVHKHDPGANFPVDPVASELAREKGISCYVSDGRDLADVERIVSGNAPINGTKISG